MANCKELESKVMTLLEKQQLAKEVVEEGVEEVVEGEVVVVEEVVEEVVGAQQEVGRWCREVDYDLD